MTRSAAFLAVLSALTIGSPAFAIDVPSPEHTILTNKDIASMGKDSCIAVVGQNNLGNPDPCEAAGRCGDFQISVRDFANNPMPGIEVMIDFSGCPDIQISCDQLMSVTGQQYMSSKRVVGVANSSGQFTFKIQGASSSTSTLNPPFVAPGTDAGVPCAKVYAQGVLMRQLKVAAYDVDGLGSDVSAAVNAADVAKVKAEALNNLAGMRARSDYNYDSSVNAADVGISARLVLVSPANGTIKTTPYPDGHYCP